MAMDKAYLDHLNEAQKEAVVSTSKRLLVLAGAGSGKTRVLTCRIAYLLDELALKSYQILALTFTNKAAREMKERTVMLDNRAETLRLSTFHSFGVYLLRYNASSLEGFTKNFSIYDTDDALALLKKTVKPAFGSINYRYLLRIISTYKNSLDKNLIYNLYDATFYSDQNELIDFDKLFELYQNALKENNAMDFDDLIYQSLYLLESNPAILADVQSRYKAILVDEYQDTNGVQAKLLKLITSNECLLTVVGDEDQSIYRFRGAEARIILDYVNDYENVELCKLEENYRSTNHILNTANSLISYNSERIGKNLFSTKDDGAKVILNCLEDAEEEAQFCAILWKSDPSLQTTILYRTNAQSRIFEKIFNQMKIKYRLIGAIRFFAREEVKTALAFFSLLANPKDGEAFARIINKPARGLGPKVIKLVEQNKSKHDYNYLITLQAISKDLSKKATKEADSFCKLIVDLHSKLEEIALADVMQEFLKESGLLDYYKGIDLAEESERVENLTELLNAINQYPNGEAGLLEFLETALLDDIENNDDADDASNKISLMTVHRAKGLEFDRVIIAGFEEGLMPSLNEDERDRDLALEEERRLCYVAITRAKKELYMCYTKDRMLYGKTTERGLSRFYDELSNDDLRHCQGLKMIDLSTSDGASIKEKYSIGQLVRHEEYGIGKIIGSETKNRRTVIQVKLQGGRIVQFFPEFTYLEIINESELY